MLIEYNIEDYKLDKNILLDKLEELYIETMACTSCGHSSRPLNKDYYNNAKKFIDLLIKIPNIKYPDIQQCDDNILFEWFKDDKFFHIEILDEIYYSLWKKMGGKHGGGKEEIYRHIKFGNSLSGDLILLLEDISK